MCAEVVELAAYAAGEGAEVAGVDADATELGAGDLDGGFHSLGDVVGVHQQGGVHAEGVDLGLEGGGLVGGAVVVDVEQGPGVGGGAGGGDTVAVGRLEVGGGLESGEIGGAGRGDRGVFVGAPRAHLDDHAAVGGGDHAGGGGGDGGVGVHDGEDDGLQDDALGEGAADGEQR